MQKIIKAFVESTAKSLARPIRVCLYGFGKTNAAIFEIIKNNGLINEITVRQSGKIPSTLPHGLRIITDKDALYTIDEDIVFASPSLRRQRLRLSAGTVITSDTELFFDLPHDNLFLVSGSDGKSTVTTLSAMLLSPTFPDLFVGGNLGVPLASAPLGSSAFVLELSSFNLAYSAPSGTRAALTNITPNHLDWHESLAEYEECKIKLIDLSKEPILCLDTPRLERLARKRELFALTSSRLNHGQIVKKYSTLHTVTAEDGKICLDGEALLTTREVARSEGHNLENLMLAIALTLGHTTREHIREVAKAFKGLSHRCESFTIDGVEYVNSSIDTTPDRTKTTLCSLERRVNVILGGRGKGLCYGVLKSPLVKYANKISLYGEAALEMSDWLKSDPELSRIPSESFRTLCEAIDHAQSGVRVGDTVLLSPAATSYGEFFSYTERGDFFKKYVSEKHSKI